jgi:hypothetical protein
VSANHEFPSLARVAVEKLGMAADEADEILARASPPAEQPRPKSPVTPEPPPDDGTPLFDYSDEPLANGQAEDAVEAAAVAVTTADFYAYLPAHQYLFVPTRELWPGSSVNAKCAQPRDAAGQPVTKQVPRKGKGGVTNFESVPMPPTEFLDEQRAVEQMTWAPGEPMVIADRLVSDGGWIDRPGSHCFNLYRPPVLQHGDADAAGPWLDHVRLVFPESADHIIRWLAHRVQRPGQKICHALFAGGAQGIGKDTIFEPVKHAVGHCNFVEITPTQLLGRFNGFVKSVILRISEARDLGELDRYGFYDHLKMYTAAPPDVIRCDEKNLREHAVMNVTGVIITSNHKTDGIYLPADDRRHYVAWSTLTRENFEDGYWKRLWHWYATGGIGHVAAYLAGLDLSGFDAKAPPPKTAAFYDIVDANRAPEDAELADALEAMGNPPAITLADLALYASDGFREWLLDRRNRRQIPHRLETAGYAAIRNDAASDGLWKVSGRRQVIYARKELPLRDQLAAASALSRGAPSMKSM